MVMSLAILKRIFRPSSSINGYMSIYIVCLILLIYDFLLFYPKKFIEKNTNVQLSFLQQKHVRAQPQIYGNWTSNLW